MSSDSVKIDLDIYSQLQKILGAMTAFGVAVVLLIVQGSLVIDSLYDAIAGLLIVVSIPLTISSFLLVYKALKLGTVRKVGYRIVDWLAVTGIGMNVGGLLGLLLGTDRVLGVAYIFALAFAFIIFTIAMKYLQIEDSEASGHSDSEEESKEQ